MLPLVDPHGLKLSLVEPGAVHARTFTPWDGGPVPGERQVRGLYGAQVWEREAAPTSTFLTNVLGFEALGSENGWTRYGFRDAAGVIDVRETPDERRGAWGVGACITWRGAWTTSSISWRCARASRRRVAMPRR